MADADDDVELQPVLRRTLFQPWARVAVCAAILCCCFGSLHAAAAMRIASPHTGDVIEAVPTLVVQWDALELDADGIRLIVDDVQVRAIVRVGGRTAIVRPVDPLPAGTRRVRVRHAISELQTPEIHITVVVPAQRPTPLQGRVGVRAQGDGRMTAVRAPFALSLSGPAGNLQGYAAGAWRLPLLPSVEAFGAGDLSVDVFRVAWERGGRTWSVGDISLSARSALLFDQRTLRGVATIPHPGSPGPALFLGHTPAGAHVAVFGIELGERRIGISRMHVVRSSSHPGVILAVDGHGVAAGGNYQTSAAVSVGPGALQREAAVLRIGATHPALPEWNVTLTGATPHFPAVQVLHAPGVALAAVRRTETTFSLEAFAAPQGGGSWKAAWTRPFQAIGLGVMEYGVRGAFGGYGAARPFVDVAWQYRAPGQEFWRLRVRGDAPLLRPHPDYAYGVEGEYARDVLGVRAAVGAAIQAHSGGGVFGGERGWHAEVRRTLAAGIDGSLRYWERTRESGSAGGVISLPARGVEGRVAWSRGDHSLDLKLRTEMRETSPTPQSWRWDVEYAYRL